MREIEGDILNTLEVDGVKVVGVCFTSNGMIKKDGTAVMGAGVAKLFRDTFMGLDKFYADLRIEARTNLTTDCGVWDYGGRDLRIIAFPTKNDWKYNSSIQLIELSSMGLKSIIEKDKELQEGVILLPRPGCSNGGLKWEDVKKIIEKILPENVVIITEE